MRANFAPAAVFIVIGLTMQAAGRIAAVQQQAPVVAPEPETKPCAHGGQWVHDPNKHPLWTLVCNKETQ